MNPKGVSTRLPNGNQIGTQNNNNGSSPQSNNTGSGPQINNNGIGPQNNNTGSGPQNNNNFNAPVFLQQSLNSSRMFLTPPRLEFQLQEVIEMFRSKYESIVKEEQSLLCETNHYFTEPNCQNHDKKIFRLLKNFVCSERVRSGADGLLIQGEAGTGKSTVLFQYYQYLWKKILLKIENQELEKLKIEKQEVKTLLIPLWVKLRTFLDYCKKGDLFDFFLDKCIVSRDWLLKNETLTFLFLIDSFDEADWPQEENFFEIHLKKLNAYCKFIITCRTQKLTLRPDSFKFYFGLESSDQVLTLSPFTKEQSEQVVEAFFKDTEYKSSQFWTAIKGYRIEQLVRQPLLLRMALYIFPKLPKAEGNDIMGSRCVLYRKYFKKWDSEQGKKRSAPNPKDVHKILIQIAFEMYLNRKDSVSDTGRMKNLLEKNNGLLTVHLMEQNRSSFTFIHKSFQEYLVAELIFENLRAFKEKEYGLLFEWIEKKTSARLSSPINIPRKGKKTKFSELLISSEPGIVDFLVDMIASKEYTSKLFNDSEQITDLLLRVSQWSKPKEEKPDKYFGKEFKIGSANALSIYVATGQSLGPLKNSKYLDFSKSIIQGADLRHGCFVNCCFKEADLKGALVSHSIFSSCNFEGADLSDVNFGQFPPTKVLIESSYVLPKDPQHLIKLHLEPDKLVFLNPNLLETNLTSNSIIYSKNSINFLKNQELKKTSILEKIYENPFKKTLRLVWNGVPKYWELKYGEYLFPGLKIDNYFHLEWLNKDTLFTVQNDNDVCPDTIEGLLEEEEGSEEEESKNENPIQTLPETEKGEGSSSESERETSSESETEIHPEEKKVLILEEESLQQIDVRFPTQIITIFEIESNEVPVLKMIKKIPLDSKLKTLKLLNQKLFGCFQTSICIYTFLQKEKILGRRNKDFKENIVSFESDNKHFCVVLPSSIKILNLSDFEEVYSIRISGQHFVYLNEDKLTTFQYNESEASFVTQDFVWKANPCSINGESLHHKYEQEVEKDYEEIQYVSPETYEPLFDDYLIWIPPSKRDNIPEILISSFLCHQFEKIYLAKDRRRVIIRHSEAFSCFQNRKESQRTAWTLLWSSEKNLLFENCRFDSIKVSNDQDYLFFLRSHHPGIAENYFIEGSLQKNPTLKNYGKTISTERSLKENIQENQNLLHLAAKKGNAFVISQLLRVGATINLDSQGLSFIDLLPEDPLLKFRENPPEQLMKFIEESPQDNIIFQLLKGKQFGEIIQASQGMTLLMWACERGFQEIATRALKHATVINAKDKMGNSALFYAAKKGDVKILSKLLQHPSIDKDAQRNVLEWMSEDEVATQNLLAECEPIKSIFSTLCSWVKKNRPDIMSQLMVKESEPKGANEIFSKSHYIAFQSDKLSGITSGNPHNYTFIFRGVNMSGRFSCSFKMACWKSNYDKNKNPSNYGTIWLLSPNKRKDHIFEWTNISETNVDKDTENLSDSYMFTFEFEITDEDIREGSFELQFRSSDITLIRELKGITLVSQTIDPIRSLNKANWDDLRNFSPDILKKCHIPEEQGLNILFVGPVGAGKSNLINCILSRLNKEVLTEYYKTQGTFTVRRTDFRKDRFLRVQCGVTLIDVWGWQTPSNPNVGQGQSNGGLFEYLLKGLLLEEETQRNGRQITPINIMRSARKRWPPHGITPFSERMHVVVYVLDINEAENERDAKEFMQLSQHAKFYNLKPIVLLTKTDLFLENNGANNYKNREDIYTCPALHSKILKVAENLSINPTNIFPVMNSLTGDTRKEHTLEAHLLGNALEAIFAHGVAFCKANYHPEKCYSLQKDSEDPCECLKFVGNQKNCTRTGCGHPRENHQEPEPEISKTEPQVSKTEPVSPEPKNPQHTKCRECKKKCQKYLVIPDSDLTLCARCGHEKNLHGPDTSCRNPNCTKKCQVHVPIPDSDLTLCAKCGHEKAEHGPPPPDTSCRNPNCTKKCQVHVPIPDSELTLCAKCGHDQAEHGPPPKASTPPASLVDNTANYTTGGCQNHPDCLSFVPDNNNGHCQNCLQLGGTCFEADHDL